MRAIGHLPIRGAHGLIWRLNPLMKRRSSAEFEIRFDGRRYRGTLDDIIDWSLFFFGSYSPQELDFLATTAQLLGGARDGVTYFDVGANVGQHALFMSRRVANVIAFEPSAWACERFSANLKLNGITNVRLFPTALGDTDAQGELGSGFEGNSGSRSLTWTLAAEKMERVAIRRGDELVREEGIERLDILKVDVEGYEKRVLTGLKDTLMSDRPVILMELIGKSEKGGYRNVDELRDTLYPDHQLFTLRGHRRAELVPFDWNGEAAVCVPLELVPEFRSLCGRSRPWASILLLARGRQDAYLSHPALPFRFAYSRDAYSMPAVAKC